MGSNTERPDDFVNTKRRMDEALGWLRKELIDMRQQDVIILRQLNQIQQTIHILNRQRRGRTLSASSLTSPEPTSEPVTLTVSPGVPGVSRTLRRLGSLPVSYPPVSMDEDDDDVYEDDDDDILGDTFDSTDFGNLKERPKITADSVHALCTLPRSNRPSIGHCVWPSIPEDAPHDVITEHHDVIEEEAGNATDEERKPTPSCSSVSSCSSRTSDAAVRSVLASRSDSQESTSGSEVTSPGHPVAPRRINTDYEVSYEKLLKRSSQIWKEVQTQQLKGGVVEEKKMAALKLFL